MTAREVIEYAEGMLTNLQPHIPQACIPGHESFIDVYVDVVLERLRAFLAEPPTTAEQLIAEGRLVEIRFLAGDVVELLEDYVPEWTPEGGKSRPKGTVVTVTMNLMPWGETVRVGEEGWEEEREKGRRSLTSWISTKAFYVPASNLKLLKKAGTP